MKLEIFRLKQGSEINEVSFKSYHVLIIEKLFPSAAWAKTQMLHKSRDPSWHFRVSGITTCKKLQIAYLFF